MARAPARDAAQLERALLEMVIELLPAHPTVPELCLRIAQDPEDRAEAESIRFAIRELRRTGLLRYRNDDQVVEPTLSALHTHALLSA